MKASRVMVWFHFSFTVFGLVALFLMTTEVITLDWLALWIIVLAIALNSFFAVMWYDETKEKPALTSPVEIRQTPTFPMISIVVSAHNQAATISDSIRRLFNCALGYRGPSEIILIDDGSTDDTYELAWGTLDSVHKELTNISARVVKHMTQLGTTEAARTGSNKAMGEYVAFLDAATPFDSVSLNSLVDSVTAAERDMIRSGVALPSHKGETTAPHSIVLIHADTLRRLLNKETDENRNYNLGI